MIFGSKKTQSSKVDSKSQKVIEQIDTEKIKNLEKDTEQYN